MSAPFNPLLFRRLPVVAILRGFGPAAVEQLIPAALAGGVCNIEVTMNSPRAAELIRLAVGLAEGRANIGAGTVTSPALLAEALAAGASFVVTPAVFPEVIQECVQANVPVMPGALTPTEVFRAWELGARVVKLFPADALGPGYVKALRGPFPQIPLMPTGGVTVETLPALARAGAAAFGVGSPLFDPARAATGHWEWFTAQARRFEAAYLGCHRGPEGRAQESLLPP